MGINITEVVRATCKVLVKSKDLVRLKSYCEEIGLKQSYCSHCKKDTYTVLESSLCTVCDKEK